MKIVKPESKHYEDLRYLGYTIPIIGGMVAIAIVWLFLGPILAFLRSIAFFIGVTCMILALLAAAVYLLGKCAKE